MALARAISKLGAASRSEAVRLVIDGRVKVNGLAPRDPGMLVHPEGDRIEIDGRRIRRGPFRALLLHKPRGVVTTRSDPERRPTVYDLLPADARDLVAVGRLDMATTGLLLFTNDTRLAAWLTDPVNAVPRTYRVVVRGRCGESHIGMLIEGILDRGEHLRAGQVTLLKASGRETHLVVVLTEGRNREVRRLFEAVGHEVLRLKRVQFGRLILGNVPPGRFRALTAAEIARAIPGAPVSSGRPG